MMKLTPTITDDPHYIRALELNKQLNNKYPVNYIIDFMREWEAITELIRRLGK